MKKLLLVLIVVSLVSFFFVGCLSVTPSEGENECSYADIEMIVNSCLCKDCKITFQYSEIGYSELDSFCIVLYDTYPFNNSCNPYDCDSMPIYACVGDDGSFSCETQCLEAGVYYAIVDLTDNLGLKSTYFVRIEITGGGVCGIDDCAMEVYQGFTTTFPTCVIWNNTPSNTLETCQQELL